MSSGLFPDLVWTDLSTSSFRLYSFMISLQVVQLHDSFVTTCPADTCSFMFIYVRTSDCDSKRCLLSDKNESSLFILHIKLHAQGRSQIEAWNLARLRLLVGRSRVGFLMENRCIQLMYFYRSFIQYKKVLFKTINMVWHTSLSTDKAFCSVHTRYNTI